MVSLISFPKDFPHLPSEPPASTYVPHQCDRVHQVIHQHLSTRRLIASDNSRRTSRISSSLTSNGISFQRPSNLTIRLEDSWASTIGSNSRNTPPISLSFSAGLSFFANLRTASRVTSFSLAIMQSPFAFIWTYSDRFVSNSDDEPAL